MGKVKTKKVVDPKKAQLKAKENLKEAKEAFTTFLKTNKLSRDEDHSKNKKLGKEFKELKLAVDQATEAMETSNSKVSDSPKEKKSGKASKEGSAGRAAKYDYPEGLTAEEKKKFRVEARKAEKGETKKEGKAKSKKDDAPKGGKAEKTTKTSKTDTSEKSGSKKKKKKGGKKND